MKKYALLFLLVFVFAAGGCGSDTHDNFYDPADTVTPSPETDTNTETETETGTETETPETHTEIKFDGSGVPVVFGYDMDNYENGRNAPNDGQTYSVPFLNYVDSSDVDENGEISADIYLAKDTAYTIKYSHSGRTLGENDIALTITAPDGKELAFDFSNGDSDEEASEPEEQTKDEDAATDEEAHEGETPHEGEEEETTAYVPTEYLTVKASLDVLPPEAPCILYFTFVAPQTGAYTFRLREAEYSPTSFDVPFEFRIYEADDISALLLDGIEMTPREMLELQRTMLDYAETFNEDGLPTSFRQEFFDDDIYGEIMSSMVKASNIRASIRASEEFGAAATYASIQPTVYNVPYDDVFQPGYGFYADSGLQALNENAFSNLTLPTPTTGNQLSIRDDYESVIVNTEEEHDRAQELEAMSNFALGQNALGSRPITSVAMRLGQCARTVVIRYDYIETQPRTVNAQNLKFTQDALDALRDSSNAFREEYGDYFVSGYTWGSRLQAAIAVTANDSGTAEKVCNNIKQMMDNAKVGLNYTSYKNAALSYGASIEVEQISLAGSIISRQTISGGLDALAATLRSFATAQHNRSEFMPLKVALTRFREVPAARNIIPVTLPVTVSHFNAVKDMNKSIFRTRCYYNALMSIPTSNLRDGATLRNSWQTKFNNLVNEVKLQVNYICESESRANSYRSRFDSMRKGFQALTERYVFYRRLVKEQNNQFRDTGWSTDHNYEESRSAGFYDYNQSSIVAGDYWTKNRPWKYWTWDHSWKIGTWTTNLSSSGGYDYRIAYLKVWWKEMEGGRGSDRNYPSVGSKNSEWFFEGSYDRGVHFGYMDVLIYMHPSSYPFTGLHD